eukprot:7025689-Prymnesium_polylepis.1
MKKIKPMSHFSFLEKIAEGFVIEAYNSTRRNARDQLSLESYDLERIERACAEMRGLQPPSHAATGGETAACRTTAAARGGGATKRKLSLEDDGTLPDAALTTEEKHVLLDMQDAIDRGLPVTKKNFCMYKFCPHAAANKRTKSGEYKDAGQTQAGRSRSTTFCAHPKCKCGYHATCYSKAHKLEA